jgi:hypothetical protein
MIMLLFENGRGDVIRPYFKIEYSVTFDVGRSYEQKEEDLR